MKKNLFLSMTLAAAFMVSCGEKKITESTEATTQATEATTETAEGAKEVVNEFTVESNDQMQYSVKELTAEVNKPITITLKHTGKMAKEVMGHNLVVLKKGTDVAAFGNKAATAKETDYIPVDAPEVLAFTKLIGGGEETSVTFTITEPGEYDYICSFPGHVALMKGKLIVK